VGISNRFVVAVTEEQALALANSAGANEDAERSWLAAERKRRNLSARTPTPIALRLEALQRRPLEWGRACHLVDAAVLAVLRRPELCGPWRPLTEREQAEQRLGGRRIGSTNEGFPYVVCLDLSPETAGALVLAALRASAPAIAALVDENLVGLGACRSRRCRTRKEELQGKIFTTGRIIREAIVLVMDPTG